MTKTEMRLIARRIGILALRKQELEEEIKQLKKELAPHLQLCRQEETKEGNIHFVLDDVDGFTCKLYSRTQLFASQEKARELLHPNTFNAIFHPTTSEVVDVRPTPATKRMGIDALMVELETLDKAS